MVFDAPALGTGLGLLLLVRPVLGLFILVFFSNLALAADESGATSVVASSLAPTLYESVQIYSVGNEVLLLLESPGQAKTSILLSSAVENSVLMGEMDEGTGALIEQEFSELSGARYELPRSKEELLKAIGLPAAASTEDQDWKDLLRVHIETALAVSPHASSIVFEALGVSLQKEAVVVLESQPAESEIKANRN